jgi:uncharacterized protein YaiE (UPF0345 family)
MNRTERSQLIDALIEGDISEADFLRLEAEFSVDPAARQEYYDRLALSVALESEAGAAADTGSKIVAIPVPVWRGIPAFAAIAAAFLALAAVVGVLMKLPGGKSGTQVATTTVEQSASGFAVIAGQVAAVWKNTLPLADGALLPSGPLHLASGVAQIELFSGVTVIVEGDAEFEIVSPMEMTVARGKVRARVPEPAHGFRIHTTEGEVVDLGTEFALNVSAKHSEVHVIDGAVEWHPRAEPMQRMAKGEALRWSADGKGTSLTANAAAFVGMTDMREKLGAARKARREDRDQFSENLRHDPRLVTYYRMGAAEGGSRRLPNEANGNPDTASEGAIVAASRAADRWGTPGGALNFSPTGSRVRVNVPGEYRSLTLLTWVKINSLDRWYNSLFLTDGHELHEPHWQIMDDGRLFFSVKKRDTWNPKKGERDKHIFYSPPFWTSSLSGQWLMIATTYDVDARMVTHYLNGRVLSQEAVPQEYLVESVSIGAASLGNWGLPERNDPHFAVRNLNGSMDEFALFAAALTPKEIADIYEHGKP